MKKFFITSFLFFILFIIITFSYISYYMKMSINIKSKFINIERGKSLNQIVRILEKEKVIKNKFLFKTIILVKTKNNPKIKFGEYFIRKNETFSNIIDILLSGKNYLRSITFPEGLTNYSIIKILNENVNLSGYVENHNIPEGSLLPETYFFQINDSKQNIIKKMQKNLFKYLQKEWENRDKNLPYKTMKEALIMASIIEKETAIEKERRLVASVFINRLKINMRLQTDPTSIYGYTKGDTTKEKEIETHKLLKERSPYNTYRNKGLPPTPICNPGKNSIYAALHPANTKYIFFVATGDGGHIFAENFGEHRKNIEKLKYKLFSKE